MKYKTTGVSRDNLQSISLTNPIWVTYLAGTTNGKEVVDKIGNILWKNFIGGDKVLNEQKVVEDKRSYALRQLRSLRLCDLCYLPEFLCEFEK